MNRRKIGTVHEQEAADYLEREGFRIIGRNFACRSGEIDIIAEESVGMPCGGSTDYLVFVEVKYREAKDRDGGPLAAVNAVKQKRIIRTARYYMLKHHLPEDTPVRFDVIGMSPGETVHIRDAFHVS